MDITLINEDGTKLTFEDAQGVSISMDGATQYEAGLDCQ